MKGIKVYFKWGLTIFLTACAMLVFFDVFYKGGTLQLFFNKLLDILAPILYGMAMAYLLTPIINWVELGIRKLGKHILRKQTVEFKGKKGWLRAISILVTWVLVLGLIYLLMSVLIPQLIDSVLMLIDNAENYYNQIYAWVSAFIADNPELGGGLENLLDRYYQSALNFLTAEFLPGIQGMLASLTGGLWSGLWSLVTFAKNLVIGVMVSIYLLALKERGAAGSKKIVYGLLPEKKAALFMRAVHRTDSIFSGFVRGKLLDSLIIGILCFIGCSLLQMPYTPLVSVVVGVTNVIPFFGPFLGAIPSAFLILLVDPLKCLYFVIFILLLQQCDGNLIGPMILGDSTGISGFWVIVAILVGGGFFGVMGMFLGVPVFACLQTLGQYIINRQLKKKNLPVELSSYTGKEPESEPQE